MLRSRRCDNPRPQHGGSNCLGIGEQKDYCNSDQCPSESSNIHVYISVWASANRRTTATVTSVPVSLVICLYICLGIGEQKDYCNSDQCPSESSNMFIYLSGHRRTEGLLQQ